jgi:RNA polymerase sigma-70 factor (ECF subfamily)
VNDDAITAAWQVGQEAWPGIALDRERFAAHVRALEPEAIARFPGDLYIATACLTGDAAAIERFERELFVGARSAIQAIDANHAFVDEAMQRLRTGLLVGDGGTPRLALYAGRGPLRSWLGVAAARTALMIRRSQQRQREVSPDDDHEWAEAIVTISTNNPELDLLKRQYAHAFGVAFRDAIAALETRLRVVLRMSFVDGVSIDEIGAVYTVHRATAARWIQRACEQLFEKTRDLLTERLALTPTELDRMTALVRSQLDVSISQLLPHSVV